jgi:Ca2+-binding RTX toxin-like protein
MSTTTDALDALLAIRDGQPTARWNFFDAVGSPAAAPGGIGNGVALSYRLLAAPPDDYPIAGFEALSAPQATAARDALAQWSSVARLGFTEVAGSGDLSFGAHPQAGSPGYAFLPSFGYSSSNGIIVSVDAAPEAGDVWLASDADWAAADFERGGAGYGVLIHEIGHAIGLKHGFEAMGGGMTLDPALENLAWTVMSYTPHPQGTFRSVEFDSEAQSYTLRYASVLPETPMPLDILAAQYLYGANSDWALGDDVYGFDPHRPFLRTIYDAGGTDCISVANFASDCVIDLRDGRFSSIAIASDPLPAGVVEQRTDVYDGTDNLAIAYGVVVENATGGLGNDRLIGNDAANVLLGGPGDDTLDGGHGNDTMEGGPGNDIYIVDAAGDVTLETGTDAAGIDTVVSSVNRGLGPNFENLVLTGSARAGAGNAQANHITGNDVDNGLSGGFGNDTLEGGAGNDTLEGGPGNDRMIGGAGNDRYLVDSALDIVVESALDPTDIDTIVASVSYGLPANVENLTLTGSALNGAGNALANHIAGNALANYLSGGGGNDTLNGLDGNDTLDGGPGIDRLVGGLGNDRYIVDSAGDVVVETSTDPNEIDTVVASSNFGIPANVENVILTGTARSVGGNALGNHITGNDVDNGLAGGGGNDTLLGGLGNDTLVGEAGNDVLEGGPGADRLNGGAGADQFRFVTTGDGPDTIVDFVSGTDKIVVVAANFGLVAGAAANLFVNTPASSGAAAFLYNSGTGVFAFDADGSGVGAALTLATLANKPPTLLPGDVVLGS